MARNSKPETKIDMKNGLPKGYKRHVNYNYNPPKLNYYKGELIPSQLKGIKRRYDASRSYLHELKGQITVIEGKIDHIEANPRSKYCRLIKQDTRDNEELELLYAKTYELEALYNQLTPLLTRLRSSKREIKMMFPYELMKLVYKELDEPFNLEELEEYYKEEIN